MGRSPIFMESVTLALSSDVSLGLWCEPFRVFTCDDPLATAPGTPRPKTNRMLDVIPIHERYLHSLPYHTLKLVNIF